MNALPSSADIDQRLAALDILVSELGKEFDQAADQAVSGVKDAGKRAANINQQIERLTVDRQILERARIRAADTETAVAAAKAEEERRRHREAAAAHARRLVDLAAAIDRHISDFEGLIADLGRAEEAVQSELKLARIEPPGAPGWRYGLAVTAVENIRLKTDGRGYVRKKARDLADHARAAWDFLLDGDGNG